MRIAHLSDADAVFTDTRPARAGAGEACQHLMLAVHLAARLTAFLTAARDRLLIGLQVEDLVVGRAGSFPLVERFGFCQR